MTDFEPGYLELHRSGELAERAAVAFQHMADCDLCARYCHVNRFETLDGAVCRTGARRGQQFRRPSWRGRRTRKY